MRAWVLGGGVGVPGGPRWGLYLPVIVCSVSGSATMSLCVSGGSDVP